MSALTWLSNLPGVLRDSKPALERPKVASPETPASAPAKPIKPRTDVLDILRLVVRSGGPGFVQFAINNACNANCDFCSFSRDKLPKAKWEHVDRQGACDAFDVLYRGGVRYLVLTGGEPTLHRGLLPMVRHAAELGMKVMLVTNAGLLKPPLVRALSDAGLSSFIISVDAASVELHEQNRGLPGVCEKIREANRLIQELRLKATASVTMSRLVDYEALPDFLGSLGFTSVVFSYPLTYLPSFFLGYADSPLVNHRPEELVEAYERVKRLKKRFHVVNPALSLEEMQRFVRKEDQRHPCLGGYRFFFLDWKLTLWRCHHWEKPMCSVFDLDKSKLVRDGCTRCMIYCYRDSSVMQHVAVSINDACQSFGKGRVIEGFKALGRRTTVDSLRSVLEELPWIVRL